jgi:hypothetical protein
MKVKTGIIKDKKGLNHHNQGVPGVNQMHLVIIKVCQGVNKVIQPADHPVGRTNKSRDQTKFI